jgi:integrase
MGRRSPRRFGAVRKLPSGRYQVRYWGPDEVRRSAPETFVTTAEAERFLALLEAQLVRQEWIDPSRGKVELAQYAEAWIQERPKLRPRTVALYRWILTKHIAPHLGTVQLVNLTTPIVRKWRVQLLADGVSENAAAKAYRLLRAILNTAVKEDELIRANPCRIPGADQEHPAERPVLTIAQVMALAAKMPERYRALVLVATFACLRWGEVAALQRRDVDLETGTIRVREAFTEQRGKGKVLGPPKSRAGVRIVTIPGAIMPTVREHLGAHVKEWPDSFVFTTESGKTIWRGNFNKLVHWRAAVRQIGQPGLHFHDLRHTGNTLAAQTGTSLRDLMARMGHDSPRAALIYQHATSGADRAIAAALDEALRAHGTSGDPDGSDDDDDGAAGMLVKVG